jgi:hypothetical protein
MKIIDEQKNCDGTRENGAEYTVKELFIGATEYVFSREKRRKKKRYM